MKNIISTGLLLTIFLISILLSPTALAEENIDIEMYIEGAEPRLHGEKSVIVAGMWNILKINMESDKPRDLQILLFQGDEKPEKQNPSNYYEWRYDYNSPSHWKSMVEYNNFSYIDKEKCDKINSVYKFCIGISDTFPNKPFYKEEWKIEIYENDKKIHSEYY